VIRAVADTLPNHRLEAERTLRARVTTCITENGIAVPPIAGAPPTPTHAPGVGL